MDETRKKSGVVWKVGLVGLSVLLSLGVGIWKAGASTGTFEANLAAAPSVLASLPEEQVLRVFPALKEGGADLAEVWDERSVLVYRSPGLRGVDLPAVSPASRKMYGLSVPMGGVVRSGYGVTLQVTNSSGAVRQASYVSTESPFAADALQSAVILTTFVILPTVLFVLCRPSRQGPQSAG